MKPDFCEFPDDGRYRFAKPQFTSPVVVVESGKKHWPWFFFGFLVMAIVVTTTIGC